MNRFGRLIAPKDGRDFRYLARSVAPQLDKLGAKPTPRKRPYNLGPLLDQNGYPQCCGAAAEGFLEAAPIMSKPDQPPTMAQIYSLAQDNDEWSGNNYNGTSVRGTMKALEILGHIKSYAWALTVDEMTSWMNGGYGTCIIGTNWYWEMSYVDKDGFMMEPPSSLSTPIGGHAWHVIWYDAKKKAFLMRNSWGTEFGITNKKNIGTGLAYVRPDFLARLIAEDGEVAAPTQVKVKPVVL